MLTFVHHPAYDADTVSDDHRFPMRKYSLLARQLMLDGLVSPGGYEVPQPSTPQTLSRAHDPAYVDAVMRCEVDRQRTRRIGFEMTPAIALRTSASVGGTIRAAERALKSGAAINTAGGSHHADGEGGAGFCVFNDVAVAAHELLDRRAVSRVLVIDCDVHQGDGTARIFAGDERVYTFSMHCEDNWPTRKAASDFDLGLPEGLRDHAYLESFDRVLDRLRAEIRPDIVFYNAGVDPHENDRLGKLCLSDVGLSAREHRMALWARRADVPLVGVIGGGYDRDVPALVRRHALLAHAFSDVFA